MREFSIAAFVTTGLLIGIRSCWFIREGRISPALAMWVLFTIAAVRTLLSYLAEGNRSVLDNILNTADIALVGSASIWRSRCTGTETPGLTGSISAAWSPCR